jgi:hypothetical protein
MSALNWEQTTNGQMKAVNREASRVYEISEVPISKRRSQFQVQITTETGAFALPRGFRTMSTAQQACKDHLNHWRCASSG